MSSPDFDELVGNDLEPDERARLERVHELLVAAGPPPEPLEAPVELRPAGDAARCSRSPRHSRSPRSRSAPRSSTDRAGAASTSPRRWPGPRPQSDATASLAVFELDDAGNWPMELTVVRAAAGAERPPVRALAHARRRARGPVRRLRHERRGGAASVPMNAPYRFDEFDGWVIVEEGSETPLLTT